MLRTLLYVLFSAPFVENDFKPLAFCFHFLCLPILDTLVLQNELFKDTGSISFNSLLPCLTQEWVLRNYLVHGAEGEQGVAWGTRQFWPPRWTLDAGVEGEGPGNYVM